MTDDIDTKRRFATMMAGISDYYRQEISKAVLAIYFSGLRPYDIEDIERAVESHMLNPESAGSFVPKLNELVKMMEGSTTDQSAVAWSKVDETVRRVGCYQDVVFDDPIIHRVLSDMGGWLWLNQQDDKAWPFVGNDFKTRYKGYRMRGEVPEYAPVLIGVANAHNTQQLTGVKFLPVLIGDQRKAAQVMKAGSDAPRLQMQPLGQMLEHIEKEEEGEMPFLLSE